MSTNPVDFIRLRAGVYSIGVDGETARTAARVLGGADLKEEYFLSSAPEHTHKLGESMLSCSLVRLAEFEEFVAETGYRSEAEREGWGWVWEFDSGWQKRAGVSWRSPFGGDTDRLYCARPGEFPALQLSWNDAAAYCAWRGESLDLTVRLPLEREWEVFSKRMNVPGFAEAIAEGPGEDAKPFKSPAEYLEALHDALRAHAPDHRPGLLWEWCDDWFDAYPGGVRRGEYGAVYKVLRGGSLLSRPVQRCREYRFRRCPTARSPYYGFRIAVQGRDQLTRA